MKNKKILILLLIIIILSSLFYIVTNNNAPQNKDLEYFNSVTQNKWDISLCDKIINTETKNACNDNFYSIQAFDNEDETICESIKHIELKKECKKEALKFKN